MDSIGDWLYFLIVIGVGIVSMINSAKKGKAEKAAKNAERANRENDPYEPVKQLIENERPAKSFWEVLQELENQMPPVETPAPVAKATPPAPPKAQKKPQPFLAHEGATSSIKRQQREEDSEHEEQPLLQEDFHFESGDLRKAIIYSEIINRKY